MTGPTLRRAMARAAHHTWLTLSGTGINWPPGLVIHTSGATALSPLPQQRPVGDDWPASDHMGAPSTHVRGHNDHLRRVRLPAGCTRILDPAWTRTPDPGGHPDRIDSLLTLTEPRPSRAVVGFPSSGTVQAAVALSYGEQGEGLYPLATDASSDGSGYVTATAVFLNPQPELEWRPAAILISINAKPAAILTVTFPAPADSGIINPGPAGPPPFRPKAPDAGEARPGPSGRSGVAGR